MRGESFDEEVLEKVCNAIEVGGEVATLGIARPNWIAGIDRDGVLVETTRSRKMGRGPQLVPAWMINTAWRQLRRDGHVTHEQLLNEFNVKRSAFVCALVALFDGVEVESDKPITLRLNR